MKRLYWIIGTELNASWVWRVGPSLMFAVAADARLQTPPLPLFWSPLLTLGFFKHSFSVQSVPHHSFSCKLLVYWSPDGGGREGKHSIIYQINLNFLVSFCLVPVTLPSAPSYIPSSPPPLGKQESSRILEWEEYLHSWLLGKPLIESSLRRISLCYGEVSRLVSLGLLFPLPCESHMGIFLISSHREPG